MQTQLMKREQFRKNLRDCEIKQFYKSKRTKMIVSNESIQQMLQADNFEFIDILTKFSYDYVEQLVLYGGINYFYEALKNKEHQENAIFALGNMSQDNEAKRKIFDLKIHLSILSDLENEKQNLNNLEKIRFQKIYYRLWFLNSQCELLDDHELITKYQDLFQQFLKCDKKKIKYECLYGFLKLSYLIQPHNVIEAILEQKQNKVQKLNSQILRVLSKILDDKYETLQLSMNLGILQLVQIQMQQVECKSHIYIILSKLSQYYCEDIFENETICKEIISDSQNIKFKGKIIEIFKIILSICPIFIFYLLIEKLEFIYIIHSYLDDEHFVIDNYETICFILFRLIRLRKKEYLPEFEEQILKYVNSKNEEVSKQFQYLLK